MGDVNLEIKLNNIDERVIKIEESGGSGGDDYITSVSNDFNVVNKKLSLSNNITTKLLKVDDKIDNPSSATDGQVLTYNGTSNEWEAKNPSASITEPTELEKGIIGGDEYNSTTTYAFDDTTKPNSCIKDNKIYTVKSNVTAFSNIEPTVTSGWEEYWEEISISKLKGAIVEKKIDLLWTNPNLLVAFTPQTVNVDLTNYDYVGLVLANNTSSVVIASSMQILRKTTERQSVGGLAIGGNCWNRIIYSVTNNGIDFAQSTNGAIDNNTNALPYMIYGIKFN